MDTLLRFGQGDELYTFDPSQQISLRDNFRDVVVRTSRLPGLSGGFDEYGNQRAPAEIGNVQVVFWVVGTSPAEMRAAKLAVGAMAAWGKKILWKRAWGGTEDLFCYARVNSIDFNENSKDRADKRIRMQVNFQVDEPRWHTLGTYDALWGDGSLWGGGALWGGTPVDNTVTGTDNTFSVTPDGNDVIYPRLSIIIPAGNQAENIRVQRRVGSRVLDEIQYSGVLSAGDVLDIDAAAKSVKLNGVDGYGSSFLYSSAAWFSLRGGIANSIRVKMRNATDQATIRLKYLATYNI